MPVVDLQLDFIVRRLIDFYNVGLFTCFDFDDVASVCAFIVADRLPSGFMGDFYMVVLI